MCVNSRGAQAVAAGLHRLSRLTAVVLHIPPSPPHHHCPYDIPTCNDSFDAMFCHSYGAHAAAAGAVDVHHAVLAAVPGGVQDAGALRGDLAVGAAVPWLADTHPVLADALLGKSLARHMCNARQMGNLVFVITLPRRWRGWLL